MKQQQYQQIFPIFLTILTFLAISLILYVFIHFLNLFPFREKILLKAAWADILVGLTIYLKTSVDFAIFIGNLMAKNAGWKNRIAIETGTALGNATGTFFVLLIWTFFKEVPLLMILMIFLASLVLLSMAEEALKELPLSHNSSFFTTLLHHALAFLHVITTFFRPLIHFILPHASADFSSKKTFVSLGIFSFTVPLILGLDDFAGYIPLFSVVNVFGFSLGVFLGHMLLNAALFASPASTIKVVKQPLVVMLGSLAFIVISFWGFIEIYHLVFQFFLH